MTGANKLYWLERHGSDYQCVQKIRCERGITNYAAQEQWLKDHLRQLQIERHEPLRLLDFGCGYGRIAGLCANVGGIEYFAFDFSAPMVEPLLRSPPIPYAETIQQRVVIGSDPRDYFKAGSFDVVLTISVLIHNDEDDARRILASLDELRAPAGELVLIENPLSPKTILTKIWHGGCWSHNFLNYINDKQKILVDRDIHPEHCVYLFSGRDSSPRYSVRSNGAVQEFHSPEHLLVGVILPPSCEMPSVDDGLTAAKAFDWIELGEIPRKVIDPNIEITNLYRLLMREQVISRYIGSENFASNPSNFERGIFEHVEGQFLSFKGGVFPWLKRKVGLTDQTVVEVGSGTGAATLALAPNVAHVHCFEIHLPSIEVAEFRLKLSGHTNITFHRGPFAGEISSCVEVDGVFLGAVLEHTTFEECIGILKDAWAMLRPGGWICVVDTPNRLCCFDHHTALLPFFSMLPPEVRLAYASRSPRKDFAQAVANAGATPRRQQFESLTRWGCGISYHEFEIALGEDIHQHIIADGYEQEIMQLIGHFPEDSLCELQLEMFAKHVHRGFSRRAFHLIIRKPASDNNSEVVKI